MELEQDTATSGVCRQGEQLPKQDGQCHIRNAGSQQSVLRLEAQMRMLGAALDGSMQNGPTGLTGHIRQCIPRYRVDGR